MTDISLKDHFDALREADQVAIQAALAAQEKAIIKAEAAAERRFELLNELRQGVATKEQFEALEKRFDDLASRIDKTEGRSNGLNAGWVMLLGVVSLVGGLIAIFLKLK